MGSTCSCSSMQNVFSEENMGRNTFTPNLERKVHIQQQISEEEQKQIQNETIPDYPTKFIIIYPTQMTHFDNLRKELLQINQNESFIIEEYQNLQLDSEYSIPSNKEKFSSLEGFSL